MSAAAAAASLASALRARRLSGGPLLSCVGAHAGKAAAPLGALAGVGGGVPGGLGQVRHHHPRPDAPDTKTWMTPAVQKKKKVQEADMSSASASAGKMGVKDTLGWKAALAEADIPTSKWEEELARGIELGLPGASSIEDKTIPTFSRGELPHYAGINTFMKAPYIEDVKLVGDYDATVMGVPFDGGTTYRSGTRFGPQGIRRISALYTPYNYERGIDLREQMTLCDAGDVFTIPANLEKSFDQISNAVAHVASTGSFPIILGGDHSIGFPTVRGLASVTSKRIGIIHVDRHADIQEKDLDERMHTTPWFHATNLPNVRPENLVQIGIGGWQVPRPAVPEMVKRETNIFTMEDIERMGIERVVEMALERAWDGCDAVYLSYDIDSIEAAFVPGTGWPEPGGLLPREALKLVGLVAKEGLCGMEIVEVSPPYDHADITSLMALRICVDALGAMVSHNVMGKHKSIIDKPFVPF